MNKDKKTALQQACDEIKGMANPYPRNDLEREYEAGMRAALRMVREHLETEQQQIRDAKVDVLNEILKSEFQSYTDESGDYEPWFLVKTDIIRTKINVLNNHTHDA